MLTREQILAAQDMEYEDVDVPEWGGSVRIRVISSRDRQKFQKLAQEDGGPSPDFMERLIIASVCDDKLNPLFTEDDVKALGKKSSKALDKVFVEVVKLNGLSQEGREEIKGE